jgi:hypothetical protein
MMQLFPARDRYSSKCKCPCRRQPKQRELHSQLNDRQLRTNELNVEAQSSHAAKDEDIAATQGNRNINTIKGIIETTIAGRQSQYGRLGIAATNNSNHNNRRQDTSYDDHKCQRTRQILSSKSSPTATMTLKLRISPEKCYKNVKAQLQTNSKQKHGSENDERPSDRPNMKQTDVKAQRSFEPSRRSHRPSWRNSRQLNTATENYKQLQNYERSKLVSSRSMNK